MGTIRIAVTNFLFVVVGCALILAEVVATFVATIKLDGNLGAQAAAVIVGVGGSVITGKLFLAGMKNY